jgi:hypothetical protein
MLPRIATYLVNPSPSESEFTHGLVGLVLALATNKFVDQLNETAGIEWLEQIRMGA